MNNYDWDSLIPLREKQSDQYVPQMEQIIQYGEYIGLEFPGDESLLYIAKQGITATLPSQWQACQTADGEMVYRNILTKQITQQHPLDQYYRNRVIQMRQQKEINSNSYFNGEIDECVLDAIEEQNNENSDSQYSGHIDEQDFQILRNTNKTKRYHLRHQEEYTRRVRQNDNQSQFFEPYNQIKSKDLKIKPKTNQYDNFLAQFSQDYSLLQPNISTQHSPSQYHASLNIQLPTQMSNKLSPQKSRSMNPLHKPSPNNQSTNTLHKIKQLNQQLTQYKNQKQLKQTLLNQIKQTNKLKLLLIKQKLNKKTKSKKNKITQKLQSLIST